MLRRALALLFLVWVWLNVWPLLVDGKYRVCKDSGLGAYRFGSEIEKPGRGSLDKGRFAYQLPSTLRVAGRNIKPRTSIHIQESCCGPHYTVLTQKIHASSIYCLPELGILVFGFIDFWPWPSLTAVPYRRPALTLR